MTLTPSRSKSLELIVWRVLKIKMFDICSPMDKIKLSKVAELFVESFVPWQSKKRTAFWKGKYIGKYCRAAGVKKLAYIENMNIEVLSTSLR